MTPVIEVRNVSKVFGAADANAPGAVVAIKSVELRVSQGEFVCLLGPSGCGKSTLLDIIAGLELPSTGDILVEGQLIHGPSPKTAMVFQPMSLFPWRTALANVELGLELKEVGAEVRRQTALAMIELVGLRGFEDKYPSQLSAA